MNQPSRITIVALGLISLLSTFLWIGKVAHSNSPSSEASYPAIDAFAKLRNDKLQSLKDIAATYYGLGIASKRLSGKESRVQYAIGQAVTSGIQKYNIEMIPIALTLDAKGQPSWKRTGESVAINHEVPEIRSTNEILLSGTVALKVSEETNAVIIKCNPVGGLKWKPISHTTPLSNAEFTNAVMTLRSANLARFNLLGPAAWDEGGCEDYCLSCQTGCQPPPCAKCKKADIPPTSSSCVTCTISCLQGSECDLM